MIKQRIKSKTYNLGHVVALLGILELNLPLLRESLGEWYGWVFIGVAFAIYGARELTTKPLNEK